MYKGWKVQGSKVQKVQKFKKFKSLIFFKPFKPFKPFTPIEHLNISQKCPDPPKQTKASLISFLLVWRQSNALIVQYFLVPSVPFLCLKPNGFKISLQLPRFKEQVRLLNCFKTNCYLITLIVFVQPLFPVICTK